MHHIDIDDLLSHMTPRDEFVLRKFYCIGVPKRTRLALLGPEVDQKWPRSTMNVRQILDRANRRLFQRFLDAAKYVAPVQTAERATDAGPSTAKDPSAGPSLASREATSGPTVKASPNATRVDPSGADSDHLQGEH